MLHHTGGQPTVAFVLLIKSHLHASSLFSFVARSSFSLIKNNYNEVFLKRQNSENDGNGAPHPSTRMPRAQERLLPVQLCRFLNV